VEPRGEKYGRPAGGMDASRTAGLASLTIQKILTVKTREGGGESVLPKGEAERERPT